MKSKLLSLTAPRNKNSPNDFYHLEHIWAKKELSIVNDQDDLNINKRRLGNFILLMETINIKVSDHRIEIKVDEYFKFDKHQPTTLMIRELKSDYDAAEETVDKSGVHGNRSKSFWLNVYQTFLDSREQRMINFAVRRWHVDGLKKNISDISIDSNNKSNEIFVCTYESKNNV